MKRLTMPTMERALEKLDALIRDTTRSSTDPMTTQTSRDMYRDALPLLDIKRKNILREMESRK